MKLHLAILVVILFIGGCATTRTVVEEGEVSNSPQVRNASQIVRQVEPEEILATVNDEVITIADYNERLNRLSVYERARYRGEEGHRGFLKQLIQRELMVQQAKELGLDKDEEVQQKIASRVQEATEAVLIETLIKQEIIDKAVVTDKEAKAYYDEHITEFEEKEKVRLRHILVATEEEAQNIHQELKDGADFAELATEKSTDQRSAKQGGDLGYLNFDKMLPEFVEAYSELKIGDISGVVKTKLGYHIIKLEDRKEAFVSEFYEVSEKIKKKLISGKQREEHQKWLNQLEEDAEIEIKETFGSSSDDS